MFCAEPVIAAEWRHDSEGIQTEQAFQQPHTESHIGGFFPESGELCPRITPAYHGSLSEEFCQLFILREHVPTEKLPGGIQAEALFQRAIGNEDEFLSLPVCHGIHPDPGDDGDCILPVAIEHEDGFSGEGAERFLGKDKIRLLASPFLNDQLLESCRRDLCEGGAERSDAGGKSKECCDAEYLHDLGRM